MNILFDGKIFAMQRVGGVNRYFAEIISRLPPEWTPTIIGTNDLGPNAPSHSRLRVECGASFRPRRLSYSLRRRRWQQLAERSAVIHPTYFRSTDETDFAATGRPLIITVYDMVFARYPELIDGAPALLRDQRAAVRHADHVVCISKFTEADLLERIPEAAGKTSVIYLGSSFAVKPAAAAPPSNPGARMFLYVGTRAKYKNFSFLARAFARAARAEPGIRLQLAGPPLAEHEQWELQLLGIAGAVDVAVYPDEPTLEKLYCGSLALLYPSLHEGFGIPPLEAMACGTVAVTANTTSLPEVMGDAGFMLDPQDETAWVDCIVQLARGTLNRSELIARGFAQAKRFSWETAAREHVRIYQTLAR